jgi:hypothetical protein
MRFDADRSPLLSPSLLPFFYSDAPDGFRKTLLADIHASIVKRNATAPRRTCERQGDQRLCSSSKLHQKGASNAGGFTLSSSGVTRLVYEVDVSSGPSGDPGRECRGTHNEPTGG